MYLNIKKIIVLKKNNKRKNSKSKRKNGNEKYVCDCYKEKDI